jgi:ribokinase
VRAAVVGHVEWVEFARVEELPRAGAVVHAHETWAAAGGGGAVAALQLARLADETLLFTALGSDRLGERTLAELEGEGVRVHAEWRDAPHRRAFCHVDAAGERTITVLDEKLRPRGGDASLPWEELEHVDALYFVSGDVAALRLARRARIVVATSRELATLQAAGVELDCVVGSGDDDGERYRAGDVEPAPRLVVTTAGALGGWAQPGGPYEAAQPRGKVADAYGCGDCFAAGLTYALARGDEVGGAVAFGAHCAAGALTGRGVHAVMPAL